MGIGNEYLHEEKELKRKTERGRDLYRNRKRYCWIQI